MVTTVSDRGADVLQFPDLAAKPAEPGVQAQPRAPVRARAREDTAPVAPAQVTERHWTPAWALTMPRLVAGIFTGASVVAAGPPSITATWGRHRLAAEYYRNPLARLPRYAYGVVHAFVLVAVLYLLGWALDSPPKAMVCGGVAALALWQLHVI